MDYTSTKKNLFYLFIFGIGMGFFEAIVVMYLRHIYYPEGFGFPLKMISNDILVAELIREICTITMLLSISVIAGKNKLQVFAYFLFGFAVWDIFYYIALKVLINWPPSFLTWDVLFLIPIIWLGPVIAPVICSLTMIILSSVILFLQDRKNNFKLTVAEWVLVYLGFFVIFITFIWDYTNILISNKLIREYFSLERGGGLYDTLSTYVPHSYHWVLFIIGIACIYLSVISIIRKSFFKSTRNNIP